MHYTLEIKTGSLLQWFDILNSARDAALNENYTSLIVDFCNCKKILPEHLVSVACIVELFHLRKCEIFFVSKDPEVSKFIEDIRLLEYWNEGFNRNKFTKVRVKNTLCLWNINSEMIDSYVDNSQKYFEGIFNNEIDFTALYTTLSEAFNNIFDHANSPVQGYTFTQYFPKKKLLEIAVCDLGIGIPNKLNEWILSTGKRAKPYSDGNAIRLATFRKISSKSKPHNKGFGLNNLYNAVQSLNGELNIIYNNGYFRYKDGDVMYNFLNINFSGTFIIVKLNVDNFPSKEEEIHDEFHF